MRTAALTRRSVLAGATASGLCPWALSACAPPPRADVLTALAGGLNADFNGVWVWLSAFVEVLRAEGLSVDVTANGALGAEPDRTELVALGLLHVNDAGTTALSAYSPAYAAAELPFLCDDAAHFERFIDDPEFRAWLAEGLDRAGLVFADAAYLGGMSGLFTARAPVATLDDLPGMRLRAMGRRDLILIEALGALGVQVAWEEVPQALQTGIASGYLNPPVAAVLFGHGSQLDYFTDLRTSASHRVVVMSKRWLDAMTPDMRALVDRGVAAGRAANRGWAQAARGRNLAALEEMGVEVIAPDPAARRAFVERALAAYPSMADADAVARAVALAERTR